MEHTSASQQYAVFMGNRRIARGPLPEVTAAARRAVAQEPNGSLLVFDATGRQCDIDLRTDAAPPAEDAARRAPGRPRLGVVAREVTLLPRHWDWLAAQPGGASVTLRRLVENARLGDGNRTLQRQAIEAVDRFMMVMAGDHPGYEEASRALYRHDLPTFNEHIAGWPADVRAHIRDMLDGGEAV